MQKDFSIPHHMSKSAFVVMCFNELQRFSSLFFLLVILNIFKREEQISFLDILGKFFLFLVAYLAISFIAAFINYNYKKFYVKDGNIIFIHGLIHREITTIPLYKIHSMRTKRGIVYRMLDLKVISFDTLASKEKEIELILDDQDWNALLKLVESQEQSETNICTQNANFQDFYPNRGSEPIVESDKKDILQTQQLKLSNVNLIKGAFCQNHLKGMAILGGALFAIYGKISEVSDEAVSYAIDYIEENVTTSSFSFSFFLLAVLAVYLFVMVLWVGNVVVRYFNMKVSISPKRLFFESGLFTRFSSQFSYDKVCTIYIKQNILERKFNCCTLNLKQAFNTTNDKNESDVKIYGSNTSTKFLEWWLGKDFAKAGNIISAHSGYGAFGYAIKTDLTLSLIATIIFCYIDEITWVLLPIVYFLIALVKGLLTVKHSCIILKDNYFRIDNGRFASVNNYIKYTNVEVVRLTKTPLTRYFHRVNLIISTNGTSFIIRSLKEEKARYIYELLLLLCKNEK